ncbi:MAG: response regulator [Methylococcales bacterium]|jgi:CheY-like chemotaxis protein|nr:response regulator [Methylococcales bacterium]MBT7445513.1 response regulator [Methylococcales bacterium]
MSDTASHKPNVLIVDDQPENIDIISNILKDNFNIMAATSGKKSIEIAQKTPDLDLILLDVMMPEMDGYETCRQLKEIERAHDVDIIFVSAMDSLEQILSGYEVGGTDYLTKPVSPDVLIEKTKLAIQNKQLRAKFKRDNAMAVHTAMTAITNTGELGIVLDFMHKSFEVETVHALAKHIINSVKKYDLEVSVQIRSTTETINASSTEPMPSLEKEFLFRVKESGRLREKGEYFIANFGCITLMIKNMPLEERRGRLRDHLAILLDGAEARLNALEVDQNLGVIINESKQSLHAFGKKQKDQKQAAVKINDDILKQLEHSFLSYGMTEEQEDMLLNIVKSGIDKSLDNFEMGVGLDDELNSIIHTLESLTIKK